MNNSTPRTLLGGLSVDQFLQDYWQKKPLLIHQAIPDFAGFLTPDDLAGLACEDEIQSRIVLNKDQQWLLEHGPFAEERFATLPETDWTLLVQSVDQHLPEGKALLHQFSFIPYARLDDLMVSYAPKGGSVGPHFDSYDVFLLQGQGTRHWQISGQENHTLVPDCDLRILQQFAPEQSWELAAGDMLYLPPQYAHWGIASSDDCMTYSIGFRAPNYQGLGQAFLAFLQDQMAQDEITLAGRYHDPDLTASTNPAKIQPAMVNSVNTHLQSISFDNNKIAHFLGQHLTEPKPEVFFEQTEPLSKAEFESAIINEGLLLDLQSQCLYDEAAIYMNGEREELSDQTAVLLQGFADRQGLNLDVTPALKTELNDEVVEVLHRWYMAGFCHLGHVFD